MADSCNRILANNSNLIPGGTVTVSAQRASTDIRLLSQSRSGGGRMAVTGPYTGAADTEIDIEVTESGTGALTASEPSLSGVGNGEIRITALGVGAVAETYTFSLLDAGTPDIAGELEFFGVTLAARVPGASSNDLEVSVTRNLTDTPLPYSTLEAISAGEDTFEGPEWDWGQPPATGGNIPAGALRIRFDGFPTIHRAWKKWDAGRFIYRLDPPLPFDVPANTRVLSVSGDYTVVLTDGVTPETYANVVTIYDLATAIEARSALATVRGAIARDTAPGGMAVTDIPLRTDAHALPINASVKSTLFTGLEGITVAADAPTENLTLEYLGRATGGGGAWSVTGGVQGELPNALTGVAYAFGKVGFTIPELTPPASTVARIAATVNLVSRDEAEGIPAICFKPLKLGVLASDKSITFTYRKRPPADCVCENMSALNVSDACLGLATGGTEMALDAEYQTRLETLFEWRRDFLAANVAVGDLPSYGTGQYAALLADRPDIDFANKATSVYAAALAEIYTSSAARTAWDTALNDLQAFAAQFGGLGSSDDPDGAPVVTGVTAITWEAALTVTEGQHIKPTTPNGNLYLVTKGGDLGGTEPTWGSATNPITDGTATLEILAPYWTATTALSLGATTQPGNGRRYTVTTAGTTAGTEPYWPTGADTVTDGSVVWTADAIGAGKVLVWSDLYMEHAVSSFAARMDYCRVLAGIVPKSDASSSAGGCWRDDPSATHWWVDESGDYLPAFNNVPYVSAAKDADGKIFSTQEFGFGIVTPCAHRLKEGDAFTITIRGAVNTYAYGEGDKIVIPVIAAAAAPFTGGADGDPTQTWTVRGSVSGALADWLYNPAAPAAYNDGEITATLTPGGIPFAVGDTVRISVEGGKMRWRRDGGAWTTVNLYGASHSLGDGLTLASIVGAAPSFVVGDTWTYRAVAKYGASRMLAPRIGQAFEFAASGVVIDVDLGSIQPVEAVLLALHTLPDTATITVAGGDAAPTDWSLSPAWQSGAILAVPATLETARYLKITIANAGSGAAIGWLWAGPGWKPTTGADQLTITRQYGLLRGQGLNPGALYRGRGNGGRWAWSGNGGGILKGATIDALMAILDHVAEQGMEPVALVPDIREPDLTHVAILDAENVTFTDLLGWQTGAPAVAVDLPFRAVLQ